MFYDRFVQASKEASGGKIIPYETFRSQIQTKTDAVRKKSGCAAVAYEVEVKQGRVVLKSKPAEAGHADNSHNAKKRTS
jgi:hypothetical protein